MQVRHPKHPHERLPVRGPDDVILDGQPLERFSHRSPAEAELLDQIDLVDLSSLGYLASHDGASNCQVGAL
jgi:hypothetical protein